jgi:VWFA-related protein
MNKCFTCLLVALVLGAFTGTASQGEKTETGSEETTGIFNLKVKTGLMQVRAVVTDREGRIVENLKKEDFELLENGNPQEIGFFSISKIEPGGTFRKTDRTQKKGDATDSAGMREGAEEQRTVADLLREPPARTTLLYVDNLHLSFSSLNWVKQALHRFINEQMTEQDVVAIATSHTLGFSQQFTRDRRLLNYSVEQIQYGAYGGNSYFTPNLAAQVYENDLDATRAAVEILRHEEKIQCPCSLLLTLLNAKIISVLQQTSSTRRNTLSLIENYAERMADLPGKRMIVLFSDGFSMRESDGGFDNFGLRTVANRAAHSGVVIYSIDAGGIRLPLMIDASMDGYDMDDPQRQIFIECVDSCWRYNPPGPDRDQCSIECMIRYPQECREIPLPSCYPPRSGLVTTFVNEYEQEQLNGMQFLAKETGGKMYWGTNNLNDSLEKAFDANRFYYVLSYYVPDRENRNRFRKLEVRVRDHPEYKVQAPSGYSLSDLKDDAEDIKDITPQQRLLDAMSAPLPITDLGVSVQADYIEKDEDDDQVSLTVYFEGDSFRYRKEDQHNVVELEILSLIYDSSGNQVDGISARVEGKLTPEGMGRARIRGYRFPRRLSLKPGIYQARVGVREEESDRIGTASTWIEVPQITENKLEMSSLILGSPLDADSLGDEDSVRVNELEQTRMIQGVPVYEKDDFFYYEFRVHRPMDASGDSGLELKREVLQGGKPIVPGKWMPVSAERIIADSEGWFDLDGELDIGEFDSGVYELQVSVKRTGSDQIVQRGVAFGID